MIISKSFAWEALLVDFRGSFSSFFRQQVSLNDRERGKLSASLKKIKIHTHTQWQRLESGAHAELSCFDI